MRHLSDKIHLGLCLGLIFGLIFSPVRVLAATVTTFSDTLSDSRPSTVSNHEIDWDVVDAGGIAEGESFDVTMPAGFNFGTVAVGDIDVEEDGVDATLAADCSGADHISYSRTGQVMTFAICAGDGGAIDSGDVVTVKIGSNADGGVNQMTNSTAASYTITLDNGGTYTDTGEVQIAIIAGVTTTATVSASLSVTVAAVADTETVNGQDLDITSTNDTMPFQSLTVNTYKAGAHDITVSTNGVEGYTATTQAIVGTGMLNVLTDGSNNFDGFRGSGGTATNAAPLAWAAGTNPTGSSANDQTGWIGYTTEDSTLGVGSADRFTNPGNYWAPFDTTAYEVAYDSGAVNAQTIRVGHMIEANALQPTGSYSDLFAYIITAIF